ncbi:MAG: PEP-CTERM sorting domain-containing protein [Phycisphaerae bacterium]|nr:PEP-CTERM sorting domain-containing protein [Phycisphaerae bacterium]
MRKTTNVSLWILLPAVVCLGASMTRAAPIEANFDAGETTTQVDGWTGMAGDGWQGAWNSYFQSATGSSQTFQVTDATPLQTGAGNYLNTTFENHRDSSRTAALVTRQFDMDTARSGGSTLTTSFLYRLDYLSKSDMYDVLGGVYFSANATANGYDLDGTTATSAWGFSTTRLSAPNFRFLNGANLDESDIVLYLNDVYEFTFTVDYDTQTYVASVENLTKDLSYTSGILDFNYKPTGEEPVADYLTWGIRLLDGDPSSKTGTYSLDSVSVTPEPATLILLTTGFGGALLRRRK